MLKILKRLLACGMMCVLSLGSCLPVYAAPELETETITVSASVVGAETQNINASAVAEDDHILYSIPWANTNTLNMDYSISAALPAGVTLINSNGGTAKESGGSTAIT